MKTVNTVHECGHGKFSLSTAAHVRGMNTELPLIDSLLTFPFELAASCVIPV